MIPLWSVSIPRAVPSANLWTNKRDGARIYRQERDAWYWLIRCALRSPETSKPERRHCEITSYRRKTLDFGNLVAGCKPIPDVLKILGVIHDDSPRWFTCNYLQCVNPRGGDNTVIAIYALGD